VHLGASREHPGAGGLGRGPALAVTAEDCMVGFAFYEALRVVRRNEKRFHLARRPVAYDY
jgi:hypothetical protein